MALLAFHYKLNPWQLTLSQRQGLWLNLPQFLAQEALGSMAANHPTEQHIITMLRLSAESREEASKAVSAYLAAQLEARVKEQ